MVSNIPDKMWVEPESVALSSRGCVTGTIVDTHLPVIGCPLLIHAMFVYSLLFSHLGRFLDEK